MSCHTSSPNACPGRAVSQDVAKIVGSDFARVAFAGHAANAAAEFDLLLGEPREPRQLTLRMARRVGQAPHGAIIRSAAARGQAARPATGARYSSSSTVRVSSARAQIERVRVRMGCLLRRG